MARCELQKISKGMNLTSLHYYFPYDRVGQLNLNSARYIVTKEGTTTAASAHKESLAN